MDAIYRAFSSPRGAASPTTRTNPRLASPTRTTKKSPGMAFSGVPEAKSPKQEKSKAEETKEGLNESFEIIEAAPIKTMLQRGMSERNVISPKKHLSIIPTEEIQRANSSQGERQKSPKNP